MRLPVIWIVPTLLSLVLVAGSPVVGEGSADLRDALDPADDSQVLIAVISSHFDREADRIRQCLDQTPSLDDAVVTLFLADLTGRSPEFLLALRNQNLGWWDIGQGLGVPVDAWFMPVKSNPRPPFLDVYLARSKAVAAAGILTLSDDDCRNLVTARMLHEYFGVTVARAMEMRASDRDLEQITVGEYRSRELRRETEKDMAANS
jgi:hypothetical protein